MEYMLRNGATLAVQCAVCSLPLEHEGGVYLSNEAGVPVCEPCGWQVAPELAGLLERHYWPPELADERRRSLLRQFAAFTPSRYVVFGVGPEQEGVESTQAGLWDLRPEGDDILVEVRPNCTPSRAADWLVRIAKRIRAGLGMVEWNDPGRTVPGEDDDPFAED